MTPPASLLDAPEESPLRPPEAVAALGRVAVVAPHPDDEALGCGGLLALLARRGQPACVIVVSDGAGSHPGSAAYPPERLRGLREAETRDALAALGVSEPPRFLRLPDGAVPHPGDAGFGEAAGLLRDALGAFAPDTGLVPWRRDPHADHRAVWHLAQAAVGHRTQAAAPAPCRTLEYPVWMWERGHADAPRPGEVDAWRLDVQPALEAKRRAVAAHRSQTTGLIADSPAPFRLSDAMLARALRPWELYLDPRADA